MIRRTVSLTALGVLLAFGLLVVLGAGEVLCASDDDCRESEECAGDGCGSDEGCVLCGCSCHVPTVLLHDAAPECSLADAGVVVSSTPLPSDGIPVTIVRPPA